MKWIAKHERDEGLAVENDQDREYSPFPQEKEKFCKESWSRKKLRSKPPSPTQTHGEPKPEGKLLWTEKPIED